MADKIAPAHPAVMRPVSQVERQATLGSPRRARGRGHAAAVQLRDRGRAMWRL